MSSTLKVDIITPYADASVAMSSVAITGGSVTGITDITVADGGTGASTAANARTNLGLVIGTDVQAYDAELAAVAGLTSAADKVPYFTGAGTATTATLNATGRSVIGSTVAAKGDLIAGTASATVGIKTVGTDGQVLSADSSQATGLNWVTLGAGSVRQSILAAPLDSSGYNAALAAGAGLNFNVDGTPTNIVMTYANGFGATGGQDLVTVLSADQSNQGTLSASNTNFIHSTYASGTSTTWGSGLVPPQYGYAFDRTKGALLNCEGVNGAVVTTDDFGNTVALTNGALISTAQFKFGASSLSLDGVNDFAKITGFKGFGDGSWEMSVWVRPTSLASADQRIVTSTLGAGQYGVTLRLNLTALNIFLSSTGTSYDIANGTAGAAVFTINQWHRIRIVFDALAGSYKVYASINGAAETADITVASSARICSTDSIRLGTSEGEAGQFFTGNIDAFRFLPCATNTSTEVPSAVAPTITDYPVHFFSIPEMKMYSATAASASAGTNPTFTQTSRLFVAVCDTNGSTVTAVRNYALKGQCRVTQETLAVSTAYSLSHNLGTKLIAIDGFIEAKTSTAGWRVGDQIKCETFLVDTGNQYGVQVGTDRNSLTVVVSNVATQLLNKATAASTSSAIASFRYDALVQRAF